MVNRSTLLLSVLIASALVQARLFPEVGLDRWISLPLLLTLLYSTPRRRPVLLAAGLIGGLLIDTPSGDPSASLPQRSSPPHSSLPASVGVPRRDG